MISQVVLTVCGVAASVVLGAISNWIYDVLRDRGVFPHRPTVRAVAIIVLASVPLLLFVVLPEIHSRYRTQLLQLLRVSISLWIALVSTALAFFLGYMLGRRRARKLSSLLEDCRERSETLEERLDRYLRSDDRAFQSRIIRPPT
jgi:drug/metabolite transporter (DMT)-like permease